MAGPDNRRALRAAAERTLRGLEPMAERVVQAALDQVAEGYAAHLTASGRVLVAQGEPVDEADAQAVAELWWAQIPLVLAPLVGVYGAGAGAMLRWLTAARRGGQGPEGDRPETPAEPEPDRVPEPDRDEDEDGRADPVRRSADLVDIYLRDPETLPERVQRYLRTAENRMRDVGDDLWKAARETLAQGVAEGDDMDQLRDRLKAKFAEHGNQLGDVRARRIARTEVLSAWHTAAYDEAWDQPEEDRPTVKEWLCVAPDTPVVASGALLAARRHYVGTLVRLATASGRSVSVTPEHPVLTRRGWLQAKEINEGDHLFQVMGIQPVAALQVEDVPAQIGQLVDALMAAEPVKVWAVPHRVDLGGETVNGEIEVVPVDRNLAAHLEPCLSQGREDIFLATANDLGVVAVLADGASLADRLRDGLAEQHTTDSFRSALLDLNRFGGGAQNAGLALVSDGEASTLQDRQDDVAGTAVHLRETGDAGSGLVLGYDSGGIDIIASSRFDAHALGGADLLDSGGVPLEGNTGCLCRVSDRDVRCPEAAQHCGARYPHSGGDASGAFAVSVASRDVIDVEPGVIGARVAPVILEDRDDPLIAEAQGLPDRLDTLAAIEATQYLRDEVEPAGADLTCGGHIAHLDASLDESSADGAVADAEFSAELSSGGSGLIAPDEVVHVDVRAYDGHVYDLSTVGGWYAADGLVIHNSTIDTRTRPAHFIADGQRVLLDEAFTVGGEPLMFPGDPLSSPGNCVNCRCAMTLDWDEEDVPRGADRDKGRQFLTEDEVAEVVSYFEEKGIVREIDQQEVTAAAGGPHTGAMVALVPSPEDVERLAVEGGLPPEELHLTLLFLGPAEDIPDEVRSAIVDRLRSHVQEANAAGTGLVEANGFAISAFNPTGEEPCIVLGVGGGGLSAIHDAVTGLVWDVFALPEQHDPWAPHVTLTYTDDLTQLPGLADRTGPITFDRLRIAYAGDITDIPLTPTREESAVTAADTTPRRWHTPGNDALAFENQQTGDGRVFAPGALYWQDGPWPLQYADEMLSGHEGAELAGAIETVDRDGDRIPASGVLYPSQPAGAQAIRLLEEGAPLGVSVDLDDVDIEFVDARPAEERDQDAEGGEVVLLASLAQATVTPLAGGGHHVRATHRVEHTASGHQPVRTAHTVEWATSPAGHVAGPVLHAALTAAGIELAAAAGDTDTPGEVLMAERSGDYLMRITRARLRGATLVSMPAFAGARITLDTMEVTADGAPERGRMREVIAYVATSPVPVSASDVATALEMSTAQARDYLARATQAGHIVRIARGLYVGAATLPEDRPEVVAAMSGNLDLPIHEERDAEWDGPAAASRVLAWATHDDGTVDADQLGAAFLWRDPDKDPATLAAYKLGVADVYERDGEQRLEIVARGVFAVAGVLSGGRGGVDIPDDEQDALRDRVSGLYRRLSKAFDEHLVAPWDEDEDEMDELEASAWQEMQALPPLPAAWFREPTPEELPPGSGGVHYADGRIYGWVAQAGVPHEAYPGRNLTIESLGDIDTTAFLRTRFLLDDGTYAKVGAFTMNVGHHRDGAECETASCQFDDTRTVAGIVTVGMNEGGMWFSGAAAPWLSEWDARLFLACQPSYHMRQERDGRWALRAVLSVPVPGHPSRLAAAAVISRANTALAASARPVSPTPAINSKELAAAIVDEMERRAEVRAEIERMAADLAPVRAELAATMAAKVKEGA